MLLNTGVAQMISLKFSLTRVSPHASLIGHIGDGFLRVKCLNQQCESTEGRTQTSMTFGHQFADFSQLAVKFFYAAVLSRKAVTLITGRQQWLAADHRQLHQEAAVMIGC